MRNHKYITLTGVGLGLLLSTIVASKSLGNDVFIHYSSGHSGHKASDFSTQGYSVIRDNSSSRSIYAFRPLRVTVAQPITRTTKSAEDIRRLAKAAAIQQSDRSRINLTSAGSQ